MNTVISTLKKVVLVGVIAGLLIAGALVAIPSLSALAAPAPQTGTPPAPQTQGTAQSQSNGVSDVKARLETRYENELKWLGTQQNNLNQANNLATRAQNLIDRLKEKGKNVEPLQTALDDFKTAIASAATMHDTAKQILDTHAGFNVNGKVTTVEDARATVASAGEALQEARQTLRNAFIDLLKVIRQYRKSVAPASPSPASPALPAPTQPGA